MHLIRRFRQIHVAFEALEGWEDCWARILRRDIRHAPAGNGGVSPAFYEVKLVLGPSPVPPVPQASFAVIQYPRAVAPAPGVLALEYAHDGDVPGSFYGGPQPRYGLMAYYDVGAVFAGYHVGIEMTGGGNVDIFSEAVAQFAYDFGSPGGGTFRLDVLLNGVSIGSHTVNDPGSGLHGWSPTADVTLAGVAVVNGDIITCLLTVGGPAPAIQAIPHSGTGSPTWLLISGALA